MRILKFVIMAAVAVILLGSLLMPVIDGYSDDTKIVKNNGGAMSQILGPADIVVTYDPSTKHVTKNGEDLGAVTGTYPIVMTDKFIVVGTNGSNGSNIIVSGTDGKANNIADLITVSIVSGSTTITYGETTRTFDQFTWGFVTDPNGEYGSISKNTGSQAIYYNKIDQIYGSNWLDTTSEWFSFKGLDVLVSGSAVTANYVEHTTDAADIFYTTFGGGNDAEYSFTVDNDGTDYTVHPRFFIVPKTVEGHTEDQLQLLSMMYVIPLFIIVAMIIAAVAIFRDRY